MCKPSVRHRGRLLAAIACLGMLMAARQAAAQSLPPLPSSPSPATEIRAQLTARQFTILSSELAARIDRMTIRGGERFEKGDVLVQFDCSLQRAQLAHAESVATRAKKTYQSDQRLVALKAMGQLELEIAGADVQTALADVAAAQAATAKCVIVAPFSGVVVEQKAREFQYATAGQALLDILDDRNLDIELIAPSRWIAWLKPGYPLQLHIDETDKIYPARITRLGGRVDPVSQSVKVIAEFTSAVPELMPGMSGRANIDPPK